MNKTNAMRQLDAAKITYTPCEYEVDENTAREDCEKIFACWVEMGLAEE